MTGDRGGIVEAGSTGPEPEPEPEAEPGPEAGSEAEAEPGVGPGPGPGADGRAPRVGVQVALAVVLVGALFAGLWYLTGDGRGFGPSNTPAKCSPAKPTDSARYPALCAALNRPDLPVLMGVPKERVLVAQAGMTLSGGSALDKDAYGAAEVQFGELYVQLADSAYVDVDDYARLYPPADPRAPVLGHKAMFYRTPTMTFSFALGGGKSTAGTGAPAHALAVAKNPDGTGGSFEVSAWRKDSLPIDDAALYRLAEAVLPGLPGWAAG
ncbi:DUF6215 domain-containing protein [Kitasatospora sp. NPDC059160]|uniref:DUF6215 domain-containing protein n=1 Tax=Kitasatospora sp. NPDC059160 TaxID=3346748 RepID=UPI00368C9534